jgi:superfamily I DNA/RNA helicase
MLIGELVPETLRFLRNNPLSPILTAYDHVIVDEYQDLNRAEQDLIDLLARHGSLAIVGDVDQSIYSFRHANPEGIVDFNARHNNTHDETLDECRRCPTRVVSMADYLICHNHDDPGVCRLQPRADNQDGEVYIVQWDNTSEENNGIAEYISHLTNTLGYQPEDVLVLTPRRLLAYELRDRLLQLGVSVHSFYHEEALESGPAQSAFALLSLLVDPDDRVALRWWLGNGHAKSRSAEYGRLREHCENAGVAPKDALESVVLGQLQIPRIPGIVERYNELRIRLQVLSNASLSELIDAILPENEADCGVLRDAALMFADDCENSHELHDRIRTHVTHPEVPTDVYFSRIMSLHKSKGLTSRAVIVTGCVDGMIPTLKRDIPQAEQRRLFYVAITRCTELLVMSSAIHMDIALACRVGARLRPGRSRVGTVYTSDFLTQLGPTAPQPIAGPQWIANGYR